MHISIFLSYILHKNIFSKTSCFHSEILIISAETKYFFQYPQESLTKNMNLRFKDDGLDHQC